MREEPSRLHIGSDDTPAEDNTLTEHDTSAEDDTPAEDETSVVYTFYTVSSGITEK